MARVLNRTKNMLQLLIQSSCQPAKVNGSFRKNALWCRGLCQAVDTKGESRNIEPVVAKQAGVFHFDTLALCRRFQNRGFGQQEAEALTEVLTEIIGAVVEHQNKLVVTKPQQEITVQQLLAQIASVKKDMIILEKSEFTLIRNDTEKQGLMIKQLEGHLKDSIKKLEGQVKLDLNLEKSRAVEAHALNEKQLHSLMNRMEVEQAQNEKKLQNLNNRIDVEVSNLKTLTEKNRNDAQKYTIGLAISGLGLYMAYLRLLA